MGWSKGYGRAEEGAIGKGMGGKGVGAQGPQKTAVARPPAPRGCLGRQPGPERGTARYGIVGSPKDGGSHQLRERSHSACGGLPPMSRIVGVNNVLARNT